MTLACVVSAWALAAPNAMGADWPGWRGTNRDGKSPDTGLLKAWPPRGPKVLWQKKNLGCGFSSAAVADGTIYTAGMIGGRVVLHALKMTGHKKWSVRLGEGYNDRRGSGPRATPVIDEGLVYLVSGRGDIFCRRADNGKEVWKSRMSRFGGRKPQWGYAESVLIYKDLAIVTPGGRQCIVALDKKTGRKVWATSGIRDAAHYSSCIAVSYQGVPMIIQGTAKALYGVNASNGDVLWKHPWPGRNTANCPTPAFSDGYVFWALGYGKGGICLKLSVNGGRVTARRAWSTRDMASHHGGYIIHDGHIYGNNGRGWACIELRTGRKKWYARGVGKGSLCYADGMLYLFAERGGRAGLAKATPQGFQMTGQFRVRGKGPSWPHPIVIGGRLYLRYDSNLYCCDVKAK